MKGRRFAGLSSVLVCLLAGCSGFWDTPASSGSGGTGSASGAFYVLNQGTSQVAGYSFPSGSTTPAPVSGSPYTVTSPLALAMSPSGSYLYVSAVGGVFVFSVSSSGALTLLNGNQAISQDVPTTMAVDPNGAWLLETTTGTGVLTAIPIASGTGLLDSTRSVQTAKLPSTIISQIAVSPASSANPYVFVTQGGNGTTVIPFTSANANPFGSTYMNYKVANTNNGGSANAVAVDPSNRLLYVGEAAALTSTQTGGLRVFTIGASSTLTEVSGSPFATGGTGPSAILATTNFVWVANQAVAGQTPGNISGYPVTSSGGSYSLGTLVNTVNAGTRTVGLAEDSTGTYILAVNSGGSPDLNTYTFDTTGKLTSLPTTATGTDPVTAIAITAVP